MRRMIALALGLAFAALALGHTQAAQREPVGDEAYAILCQFYRYDANLPLNANVERSEPVTGGHIEWFSFDSPKGGRVPGILIVPEGKGPFPVALALHGYGGSKNTAREVWPLVAALGVAVISLDAVYHGDRAVEGVSIYDPEHLVRSRDALIQSIIDYRRALDYAATREDLDVGRVVCAGGSMGAIMGVVLTAVEPRIDLGIFIVGGADWELMAAQSSLPEGEQARKLGVLKQVGDILTPVDPLHFAPHLAPRPALYINGRQDTVVPVAANKRLHEVASEPKTIKWFDSGHSVPEGPAAMEVLNWLIPKLNALKSEVETRR